MASSRSTTGAKPGSWPLSTPYGNDSPIRLPSATAVLVQIPTQILPLPRMKGMVRYDSPNQSRRLCDESNDFTHATDLAAQNGLQLVKHSVCLRYQECWLFRDVRCSISSNC